MEQLAESLPILLTLPAPGWHLVATQNLATEKVQVPTWKLQHFSILVWET